MHQLGCIHAEQRVQTELLRIIAYGTQRQAELQSQQLARGNMPDYPGLNPQPSNMPDRPGANPQPSNMPDRPGAAPLPSTFPDRPGANPVSYRQQTRFYYTKGLNQ
jgi:hypothetical protein